MVEKLKTVIPRKLFKIPIQAAVGGKNCKRNNISNEKKMYLLNVMVEISQERKKLLENKKEEKKKCVKWKCRNTTRSIFISIKIR